MAPDPVQTRESGRVRAARADAAARVARRRNWFRPLGVAMAAIVIASTTGATPGPGLSGRGAAVSIALGVWLVALVAMLSDRSLDDRPVPRVAAEAILLSAGGVALAALQVRGASQIAGSVAVWAAMTTLPPRLGAVLAAAITAGLAASIGLNEGSLPGVAASTLLCVLLGVTALFMRQSRQSQDRTELLLAELEDARDDLARAAVVAERGRIAGELHDVLAHSLSGAAIQLQGARKLAERAQADENLRAAIDRASELVIDGLADAREAVGTLRGARTPNVRQIESLVAGFRRDMNVDAQLRVDGGVRALPADAELALYRGAQEALTNAARYAPGATVTVELTYGPGRTTLTVEDHLANGGAPPASLGEVGGGRGLAGMRSRVEQLGGRMSAGPTGHGWRVRLEVPA